MRIPVGASDVSTKTTGGDGTSGGQYPSGQNPAETSLLVPAQKSNQRTGVNQNVAHAVGS